jgi:putative transposase
VDHEEAIWCPGYTAHARGVKLASIQPGEPTQNACIKSFNGRLRDECLNDHWFSTLHEVRVLIEAWRKDYNSIRPHSSLGNNAPAEFAAQHQFATRDSTRPYC